MDFRILSVSVAMLVAILSPQTHATTVLYKSFDNLVDESDHVVGGTIKSIKAKKHQAGEIYTEVFLTKAYVITETGKEETKKQIKLRYKGGEIDAYGKQGKKLGVEGLYSYGTPELTVGEKVILFISNNGISDMPIYGWGQGLFRVNESNSVYDVSHAPVVGIDSSHLIRKVSDTLSSTNLHHKKLNEAASTATLISSDGGEDTIITRKQANENVLDKISSHSAMHISHFVSMIQERKAMHKSETGKIEKDISDLFTLPEVIATNSNAQMDSNQRTSIKPNTVFNEAPAKPLSKPTRKDTGR